MHESDIKRPAKSFFASSTFFFLNIFSLHTLSLAFSFITPARPGQRRKFRKSALDFSQHLFSSHFSPFMPLCLTGDGQRHIRRNGTAADGSQTRMVGVVGNVVGDNHGANPAGRSGGVNADVGSCIIVTVLRHGEDAPVGGQHTRLRERNKNCRRGCLCSAFQLLHLATEHLRRWIKSLICVVKQLIAARGAHSSHVDILVFYRRVPQKKPVRKSFDRKKAKSMFLLPSS